MGTFIRGLAIGILLVFLMIMAPIVVGYIRDNIQGIVMSILSLIFAVYSVRTISRRK